MLFGWWHAVVMLTYVRADLLSGDYNQVIRRLLKFPPGTETPYHSHFHPFPYQKSPSPETARMSASDHPILAPHISSAMHK